MTFIAILIALIIERFFHWSQLRNWGWFTHYQQFLGKRVSKLPPYLLLVAYVLPPALIILFLSLVLSQWGYGIPGLILGVAVLVYCLGPSNLWVQIYECIRALNKEDSKDLIHRVKTSFGITSIENPQSFHQAFTRAIFIAANQQIFAILFWFALLGPLGAVLYRLINLCTANSNREVAALATKTQHVLDWVPVRLFTFVFALAGSFTKVFSRWIQYAKQGWSANDKMLGECGVAALDVSKSERIPEDGTAENEALALLDRVFIISLVILAAITLVL